MRTGFCWIIFFLLTYSFHNQKREKCVQHGMNEQNKTKIQNVNSFVNFSMCLRLFMCKYFLVFVFCFFASVPAFVDIPFLYKYNFLFFLGKLPGKHTFTQIASFFFCFCFILYIPAYGSFFSVSPMSLFIIVNDVDMMKLCQHKVKAK